MSRRLNLAVAASLLLHAAVLVLLPMLDAERPPAPPVPMTARLVEQPRPAAPRAETPAPQPPAPAKPEPRPVQKPAPKPEQKAVEMPRPVEPQRPAAPPVSQTPPVVAAPPAPSPQPAPSVAPQPAQRTEPAVAAAPPQGGAAPPSQASGAPGAASLASEAATIGQYRVQLIELAGRYKRYPRIAQDNNWTGTAEVRLSVGADGAIASISVRRASGHAVLDNEALGMIRTAFGKLPLPESLRGRAFSIDVPVVFSLKDE